MKSTPWNSVPAAKVGLVFGGILTLMCGPGSFVNEEDILQKPESAGKPYFNVDIRIVGLTTLAHAPWTFKMLWSPLMDRYVPPWLGRRRGEGIL